MDGRNRVSAALAGVLTDRLPCLPILHSGLPSLFGEPLGAFFTDAQTMADTIVRGYQTFGYDGVQLSLGVTGEAEALGARVEQPRDAGPVLKENLVSDLEDGATLERLRSRDPTKGGRMPLYEEAVRRTVGRIGDEAFVLAMLRGPLLAASQLYGVENLLIGTITEPEAVRRLLALTSEIALRLGTWLTKSGAHALILGEATCSPNFISPKLYRDLVLPSHTALVTELRAAGWQHVGLHICGNIAPIFEDIISTGVDFLDVDYQVAARQAIDLAKGRVALRGNLDPSGIFRFGTANQVAQATQELCEQAIDCPRWILSSGCDIPPGTPEDNVMAFVNARDRYGVRVEPHNR
ncbi:MAG: uroporphyrinogen decarboxylase family protein [Anaerolineae bacterium]